MDYEKKYKEALNLAKSYYEKEDGGANQFLDTIFPELRESEDERIRKVIRSLLENARAVQSNTALYKEYDDALAWLEKQKEQKPAEWSDTNELVFKDICKHLKEEGYNGWVVLLNALRNGEFQPKQEQNDYITPHKEFFKFIYDRLINVHKENPNVDYMRSFKERLDNLSFEERQEWSEEDIKKIRSEEYTKGFNDAAFGGQLKEWSVEDEDRIRQIERIAQQAGCTQKLQEEIHAWLKSLRPSWRPSEEQMEALINCVIGDEYDVHALVRLWAELKKL